MNIIRYLPKALILAIALALLILTYSLQTYIFTSLEESYIFLFDWKYVGDTLMHPGGMAQLMASFLTQFMRYAWTGPLLTAVIYLGILVSLAKCCRRHAVLMAAFAAIPCFCLFLCLENAYYKYQGHTAMLLSSIALWLYTRIAGGRSSSWRLSSGVILSAALYFLAGSAALFAALGMLLYDIASRQKRWYLGVLYIALPAAMGWLSYRAGLTYTLTTALTPAMYYDLKATYFMMLYALSGLPLCMLAAALMGRMKDGKGEWIWASGIVLAVIACMLNVYRAVHSRDGYENRQMRYYALRGQWDEIAAMPYDGSPTPFTDYRFIALAKRGELDRKMKDYRPFIDYFMTNKPLVKKTDQQMMSDMYYQCDYMAAARRAAFDTDIVTPGDFNPEETCKLVTIHLAYGNYRVAEKLITQLEKTLFYRGWAAGMRRFLDNDALVEADSVLGPKRRAIPATDSYITPWGLQRELQSIVETNPDQVAARQFLNAFKILTFQK